MIGGGVIATIIGFIVLIVVVIQIIVIIDYKWEYPNLKINEADVRQQIANEASELDIYKPIIKYLEEYKAKHGVYPKELPQEYKDITSEKFDMFDYRLVSDDGSRCFVKILPKHGPVEYYQHKDVCNLDKHKEGVKRRFLDMDYYYNVGDEWQAVHFKYYTRYKDAWGDVDMCLDDSGCYDYIRHRCEFRDNGYCQRNEKDCIERNGIWQEDKKYCIYREAYYGYPRSKKCMSANSEIIVGKNKYSDVGAIRLEFDPEYGRFYEIDNEFDEWPDNFEV